jgi:hypothetical protein
MNTKIAAPIASAAIAIMLLGACSDDGSRTLARRARTWSSLVTRTSAARR